MTSFVALDFETADYQRTSACAIGLVKVKNGRVAKRVQYLIRPPSNKFVFTYLHGISWEDVQYQPIFAEVWPKIKNLIADTDFIAAHNASFDRSVLVACCAYAGVHMPNKPFICTVQLARKSWGIFPTKLDNVCQELGIKLNHHHALSDAEACAQIVLKAVKKKSFNYNLIEDSG